MEESSDAALLGLIAQTGDRQAFAELFDRYRLRAYNLARHILHDPAEAEDAVQEAMLAVWTSAGRFRYEKNAKGWILKIVAAKCLQTNRKQGRNRRREERMRDMLADSTQTNAGTVEEREESLQTLQIQLERLPRLERQLLALYYGADLAQDEISRMLSMPQRTISHKLRGALERLRAELASAGVGAVASLLSPVGLREALTTGTPVPPGLYERTLEDLANAGRVSHRLAPAAGGSAFRVAAVAFSALAAVVLVAYVTAGPAPAPKPNTTHAVTLAPRPAPSPEPKQPFAGLHLDFRKQPSDLKLLQGNWVWHKDKGMETASELPVFAALPDFVVQSPLEIIVTFHVPGNKTWTQSTYFYRDYERLPFRMWGGRRVMSGRTHTVRQIMSGRYTINYSRNETVGIFEYEAPDPSSHLTMGFHNLVVEEVRIRPLAESDLPEEFKDPLAAARALGFEPWHCEPYTFQTSSSR